MYDNFYQIDAVNISKANGGEASSDFTYTGSVATDRLMYSFWGIRITIYCIFFIINLAQVYHTWTTAKKLYTNNRFLIFINFLFFCSCRIVGDAFRYKYPNDYKVGSLYYFFFAFGVFFILIAWVFIAGYWMSLLYTFYISSEIKLDNTRKVRIFCYTLSGLYFIWMAVIQIVCLFQDQTLLESIGFLVFFILFGAGCFFNGIKFSTAMKESQKKSKMKHFDRTIFTTRVLVITAIISVFIIVVHDIIFNFVLGKEYIYFPISTFITMFVDVGQMIVILYILGGGTFKNYLLLQRAHNSMSANSEGSSTGGGVIDLSKGQSNSSSRMNSQMASMELNSKTIEVSDVSKASNSIAVITPPSSLPPPPTPQIIDIDENAMEQSIDQQEI